MQKSNSSTHTETGKLNHAKTKKLDREGGNQWLKFGNLSCHKKGRSDSTREAILGTQQAACRNGVRKAIVGHHLFFENS